MTFLVIVGFRNIDTKDFPVTRTLVAYDAEQGEDFLRSIGVDFYDVCPIIETGNI